MCVRYTFMTAPRPDDLAALDEALVRLRRLWAASRNAVVDDLGQRVEMSSVLVVEACARGATAGAETSVGDVAAFLDVEPSTASRLVDRAARAGLLRRTPAASAARRSALVLTDDGRALRTRATAARLGWLRGVVHDWSDADLHALAAALGRFADAVGGGPVPPPAPPPS